MAEKSACVFTFRGGRCEIGANKQTKCLPEAGLIYFYEKEDLLHLGWRQSDKPSTEPAMELIMFPEDGVLTPYTGPETENKKSKHVESPGNGRIIQLLFQSGERHLFWMQAEAKDPARPNRFSKADLLCVAIVNKLLKGGNASSITKELKELQYLREGPDEDDEDENENELNLEEVAADTQMGEADEEDENGGNDNGGVSMMGSTHGFPPTGGAGADATGGDVREEGSDARDGGADGARAATDSARADDAVQSIVDRLISQFTSGSRAPIQNSTTNVRGRREPYTTLQDLLTPEVCLAAIREAPESILDQLLSSVPPTLVVLEEHKGDIDSAIITQEAAEKEAKKLNSISKKLILERVVRSPQFAQSLASLTNALQEGGLPSVSQALGIDVENGGLISNGAVPLGGDDAVKAFVEGVLRTVMKENTEPSTQGEDAMDTSGQ